jgi:hypothetical protein
LPPTGSTGTPYALAFARFETLHYGKTRETVREVTYWKTTDPRPLDLIRQTADVVCPRSDGDAVGLYLKQLGEELPVHLARTRERQVSSLGATATAVVRLVSWCRRGTSF